MPPLKGKGPAVLGMTEAGGALARARAKPGELVLRLMQPGSRPRSRGESLHHFGDGGRVLESAPLARGKPDLTDGLID